MLFPYLCSGIKARCDLAIHRVYGGQVRAFVTVAFETGKRQACLRGMM